MRSHWSRVVLAGLLPAFLLLPPAAGAQRLDPIVYTLKFPAPDTHVADVVATIPTGKAATVELMIPVWSPGYYVQEDYVRRLHQFVARGLTGDELRVEQPQPNRWRVTTGGAATITLTYELECSRPTVTGNSVVADYAVINGAPTFVTLVESTRRMHEVHIELPAQWHQSATSLAGASDKKPNDYVATSYDELVDSPIIIGNIRMHRFVVAGSTHYLADIGDIPATYNGDTAAAKLEKIARANARFWGGLPFRKYVFLNVFRQGGGGLEHLNSTLLTSNPRTETGTSLRWLDYVAHEYFHAENVKRFRPVELGPFDYEHAPRTAGLWLAEGVTSYYGDLLVSRSGVGSIQDFLSTLSAAITAVQNRPGRLVQTLEQASLGIFATGGSGVGGNASQTVSYYDKGQVVGWVLDARIQHASNGRKTMDDFMRHGMRRYGGAHGYTPDNLVALASELAGTDLTEFMRKALRSTEELDYTEALDWFGLRFAASTDPTKAWNLEVRPDATPAQQVRFKTLAGKYSGMDSALFRAVVLAIADTVKEDLRIDPLLLRGDTTVDLASAENRLEDTSGNYVMRRAVLRSLGIREGDVLERVACAGVMVPDWPVGSGRHRECPLQPYSVVAMGEPRAAPQDTVDRTARETARVNVRVLVYRFGRAGLMVISYDYVLARTGEEWTLKRRMERIIHE